MRIAAVFAFIILAGCAATPEALDSVAKTESARMAAPTRPFSTFASFELKPMVLSPAVSSEPGKVEAARELEAKLRQKLQPLLDQWAAAPAGSRSGTLVIEPQLASLKVVSGGARFWAGAMAGDSNIDLDLLITERETGQVIARPRVARSADAMTGGWSVGQSDENLLDYICAIAYEYLSSHY